MAKKEVNMDEWKKVLVEAELIGENESIERHTYGDYWNLTGQSRGNYFFTADKMVFISGLGVESFAIRYADIKEIKKCMISMFLPTGIKITAMNPEKGKTKKYKCSVMKRKEWIDYLYEKTGLPRA